MAATSEIPGELREDAYVERQVAVGNSRIGTGELCSVRTKRNIDAAKKC